MGEAALRSHYGVRRWRFDCDTLTQVAQLPLVSLEAVVIGV
jgi:hypothetical protein